MSEFTIKLAERSIGITSLYSSSENFCKGYLTEAEPDFSVEITADDIEYEKNKSARTDRLEGRAVTSYRENYLETLAIYRKIAEKLPFYDTVLFHGSAIAVDGVCYLFTAKSGTGKSTHARLWRKVFGERAVMVNDDKPLIRIDEKGVVVYGTPWNGKHRLGNNMSAPLKAICILERDENNRIEQISKSQAWNMLIQQTYRPSSPEALAQTLFLLDNLSEKTELYLLGCNMEEDAAVTAYNGMNMEGRDAK